MEERERERERESERAREERTKRRNDIPRYLGTNETVQRAIVRRSPPATHAFRGDDSRCRPRLPQEGIIGNRVSRLHRQRQSSNIQVPTILPDGRYLSLAAVQVSVGSSGDTRTWPTGCTTRFPVFSVAFSNCLEQRASRWLRQVGYEPFFKKVHSHLMLKSVVSENLGGILGGRQC